MSLSIFETTQFSAKVYKNISILCDISTKCLKIPPIKFSETHVLTFNHSNTQRNTNFAPEEVHSSRIVARFLSRCSQLLNIRRESAATAEERRKITFCMRIAKPQETPIHSPRHWRNGLLARACLCTYAPVPMCTYARLILGFSRKTSDRVSLDQWQWRHGARGVNYTWGYIPTQSPPIPISRAAPLSFLLSHIYSPRSPFIQPDIASCLLYLLTPTANISIKAIIIFSIGNKLNLIN